VESVATRNDELLLERADVNAVLATQPADATIFALEAPEVLAISGRRNIWPWQLFDRRMQSYLDHTRPGGLAGLANQLAAQRPTFVVIGDRYIGSWQQAVVQRDYVRVGHGPAWTWYLSRATGPAALARARADEATAMAATTTQSGVDARWAG